MSESAFKTTHYVNPEDYNLESHSHSYRTSALRYEGEKEMNEGRNTEGRERMGRRKDEKILKLILQKKTSETITKIPELRKNLLQLISRKRKI
jgi:hypothetical protein